MNFAQLSSIVTRQLSPVRALSATSSGSLASTIKQKLSSLEPVDFYFFLLRLLTIVGLALYYFFTAKEYSAHQVFAWFFPLYVFYSVLLYAGILYWPHAIRGFYLISLVADLSLLFVLMLFVGLSVGSFFMGFYLLVAVHSFYFGLRVGIPAALAASLLYSYLYLFFDSASLIPWPDFLVRISFLFMISLSLGLISENEREQRRMLAGALHQASLSNRLKDQFLANLSHEFRTPLTYVMGYAEVLLDGPCRELSPEYRTLVERIHEGGQELLSLFNRLMKFSRLKSGDTTIGSEPIELRALLWEITENLRPRSGNGRVSLKLDYPVHPVVVQSDPTLLHQVVHNLVSNALKFTEQGFVQVSLFNGDSSDAVRIMVEDTGIGIRTDELTAIFEEFRQGADAVAQCKSGAGLGLAIVEESVKSLSGTIQVESVYGKGSKFTVTLPKELRQ